MTINLINALFLGTGIMFMGTEALLFFHTRKGYGFNAISAFWSALIAAIVAATICVLTSGWFVPSTGSEDSKIVLYWYDHQRSGQFATGFVTMVALVLRAYSIAKENRL